MVSNMSFEHMLLFKYLRTTSANQNCIHKELKNMLNSGSFRLLHKNVKIKIDTIIILSLFVLV
jgi:hypothetical protein